MAQIQFPTHGGGGKKYYIHKVTLNITSARHSTTRVEVNYYSSDPTPANDFLSLHRLANSTQTGYKYNYVPCLISGGTGNYSAAHMVCYDTEIQCKGHAINWIDLYEYPPYIGGTDTMQVIDTVYQI